MLQSTVPIVVAALAVLSGHALAADSANQREKLEAVLGEIDWGDSHKQVIDKIRAALLDRLRSDARLKRNRSEMQKARDRVIDKVERIRSGYEKLDSKTNSYQHSVIADDITFREGESLLRVRDNHAQRFFFFHEDSLYKLVVAYKSSYLNDISFRKFLIQTGYKYGRPDKINFKAGSGDGRTLTSALWSSETTRLRLENHSDYFGTFTMTFADSNQLEQLDKANSKSEDKQKEASTDGLSDRIKAITTDRKESAKQSDETASGDDQLMQDLFGDVDVSLRPGPSASKESSERQKEQKERKEKPKKSAQNKTPEQSKKAKKESQTGAKDKEGDEKDKTDEDLIIY